MPPTGEALRTADAEQQACRPSPVETACGYPGAPTTRARIAAAPITPIAVALNSRPGINIVAGVRSER
jgi:hypothetical protein